MTVDVNAGADVDVAVAVDVGVVVDGTSGDMLSLAEGVAAV